MYLKASFQLLFIKNLAYEFLIVNIFRNKYLILIVLLWNLTIFGVSQQRVLVQEEIVTSLEL